MKYLANPIVHAVVIKLLIALVAYLLIHFHITLDDVQQAEQALDQLQHSTVTHHVEHHPEIAPGLLGEHSPGCATDWDEFWSWLTGNSCAGGSR